MVHFERIVGSDRVEGRLAADAARYRLAEKKGNDAAAGIDRRNSSGGLAAPDGARAASIWLPKEDWAFDVHPG